MNYPLISEYIEAIKAAEENFEQLKNLRPVLDEDGEPVFSSGNFAVVFKMKDEQTGKLHAVKCFLREQEGRAEAYRMIAEELEFVNSTFLTPIKYLDKELFVDTNASDETEFPVLLMDWVEGQTLDMYIREHIDDQYELSLLAYQFSRLAMWLMPQPFAHGDLKPDNILVKDDGTLVLVDYDGMYVPTMKGQKARELGSPDFRHPSRTEDDFDEHIDDFSLASILLSLKAIALQPDLLEEYGSSDRLLFSEKDYRNLSESKVIDALKPLMQDAELASLYSLYILASSQHNLSQVSFRLFNLNRPQVPIPEDINGYWQYIKRTGIWTDKYGVKYSTDKTFLINAPNEIREYTVPKGTKYIAPNAFINCRELRSISLPNTLEVIGNIAFLFCVKLSSITIPKSVKEVGLGAFEGCFSLTTIVVDNNNMFYDSRKNCNAIIETQSNTLITGCSATVIPNSITKIGKSAFNHCNTLKVIIIPENILEIDDYAFSECYSLEKIIIPESVKKIGNKAFDRCQSLYSVEMTNGLEVIGSWTFAGCRSLTSIAMPNSINKIGKDLFLYCEKLTTIYIPYGEMGKFKSLLPKYKDLLVEQINQGEICLAYCTEDSQACEDKEYASWQSHSRIIKKNGKLGAVIDDGTTKKQIVPIIYDTWFNYDGFETEIREDFFDDYLNYIGYFAIKNADGTFTMHGYDKDGALNTSFTCEKFNPDSYQLKGKWFLRYPADGVAYDDIRRMGYYYGQLGNDNCYFALRKGNKWSLVSDDLKKTYIGFIECDEFKDIGWAPKGYYAILLKEEKYTLCIGKKDGQLLTLANEYDYIGMRYRMTNDGCQVEGLCFIIKNGEKRAVCSNDLQHISPFIFDEVGQMINDNEVKVTRKLNNKVYDFIYKINNNGWKVKESTSFDPEEIIGVYCADVITSKFGLSVRFKMKDIDRFGEYRYIPLSEYSTLHAGDNFDMTNAIIITLCREGEDDIYRVIEQ